MVLDAAGRADDDVNAAAQHALLRAVLRAAVQHEGGEVEGLGIVLKVGGNLCVGGGGGLRVTCWGWVGVGCGCGVDVAVQVLAWVQRVWKALAHY